MSRLQTIERGEGPALVLLHSGGMSSEEWKPHLGDFARSFRTIVPDLPGHGGSPMEGERLTIAELGRAVVELIDELGLEKAHLVGSSMGGATALWVARNAPSKVDRLVLYRVSYRKEASRYQETLDIARPERWERLGLSTWLSRAHEPQGGPQAWKEVIARVAEAMDPRSTDHSHSLDDLASLPHKTLIAVGDRDPLVPLSDALAMAEAIPESALWVMPDATHITATNTWRREIFDREVTRFLRRGLASRGG